MEHEIDLQQYLHILVRRWWLLLLPVVVLTGIKVGMAVASPTMYEATALVSVDQRQPKLVFDPQMTYPQVPTPGAQTLSQMAVSGSVVEALAADVGALPTGVVSMGDLRSQLSVGPGSEPNILRLTAVSRDSQAAPRLVNAWADVLVRHLEAEKLASVDADVQRAMAQVQVACADLGRAEERLGEFAVGSGVAEAAAQVLSLQQAYGETLLDKQGLESVACTLRALREHYAGLPPDSRVSPEDQLPAEALVLRMLGRGQACMADFGDQVFGAPASPSLFAVGNQSERAGRNCQGRLSAAITNYLIQLPVASEPKTAAAMVVWLDGQLAICERQVAALDERSRDLERAIVGAEVKAGALEAERSKLALQRDVAFETYATLLRRLEEVRVLRGESADRVRVVERAKTATKVGRLQPTRLAAFAVLGLIVGLISVVAVESLAANRRRREDRRACGQVCSETA
ncbi:MAG: Wzz/FepE/Etk N-terminal domain-containing protein [Anaerolineae bacterium]